MNPILQWAVIHSSMKKRARKCPKCGDLVLVHKEDLAHTVTCRSCGSDVPPSAAPE